MSKNQENLFGRGEETVKYLSRTSNVPFQLTVAKIRGGYRTLYEGICCLGPFRARETAGTHMVARELACLSVLIEFKQKSFTSLKRPIFYDKRGNVVLSTELSTHGNRTTNSICSELYIPNAINNLSEKNTQKPNIMRRNNKIIRSYSQKIDNDVPQNIQILKRGQILKPGYLKQFCKEPEKKTDEIKSAESPMPSFRGHFGKINTKRLNNLSFISKFSTEPTRHFKPNVKIYEFFNVYIKLPLYRIQLTPCMDIIITHVSTDVFKLTHDKFNRTVNIFEPELFKNYEKSDKVTIYRSKLRQCMDICYSVKDKFKNTIKACNNIIGSILFKNNATSQPERCHLS